MICVVCSSVSFGCAGIINAAHGVAFDAKGNLFVAEWTLFGRLHRFDRL